MAEIVKTGERVYHELVRADVGLGRFATDLAYIGGVPTLVFEWQEDGQPAPGSTVQLDPQYLSEVNWPKAKYMYQFAIEDPRAARSLD